MLTRLELSKILSFIVIIMCINDATASLTTYDLGVNDTTLTDTDFDGSNNDTFQNTIITSTAESATPNLTLSIGANHTITGAIITPVQNLTLSSSGGGPFKLTLRPDIQISPYYSSNTYTGTTTIDSGTILNIDNYSCISENTIYLNGGTLQFDSDPVMNAAQNITLLADSTIDLNNCAPSFQDITIDLNIYNLTVLNNSKGVIYDTVNVYSDNVSQSYDPVTYPTRLITYYDLLGNDVTLMDGEFITSNGGT